METQLVLTKKSPAVQAICQSDPVLGQLIDLVGDYALDLRTDYFSSLARAIVGQQLSVKAARTIWLRLVAVCGEVKPETVAGCSEARLREAGLSGSKAGYVKDLAERVICGRLNLGEVSLLDDSEAIDALTEVKGVGRWTAEMFLIFSLGRPDVLSVADAGIRASIKWLYCLETLPASQDMLRVGKAWEPYRTAASLYLWEAVNRGYIQKDHNEVFCKKTGG